MIRMLVLLLLLALAPSPGHAIDPIEFKDRAEEVRFQALTRELRCLVCQNESLADSTAGLARDLRNDVITQMREGKSDEEIKDYMTARYGDFILYDPPIKPGTWLLWFGPLLLLAAGAAALAWIVRRRSPRSATDPVKDPIAGDWQ